jgi:hypothetical protein
MNVNSRMLCCAGNWRTLDTGSCVPCRAMLEAALHNEFVCWITVVLTRWGFATFHATKSKSRLLSRMAHMQEYSRSSYGLLCLGTNHYLVHLHVS